MAPLGISGSVFKVFPILDQDLYPVCNQPNGSASGPGTDWLLGKLSEWHGMPTCKHSEFTPPACSAVMQSYHYREIWGRLQLGHPDPKAHGREKGIGTRPSMPELSHCLSEAAQAFLFIRKGLEVGAWELDTTLHTVLHLNLRHSLSVSESDTLMVEMRGWMAQILPTLSVCVPP